MGGERCLIDTDSTPNVLQSDVYPKCGPQKHSINTRVMCESLKIQNNYGCIRVTIQASNNIQDDGNMYKPILLLQ